MGSQKKLPSSVEKMLAFGDVLEKILLFVGAITIAGFVCTVLTDVVYRTFFTPLVWMEEISRLLYMWSIFLGAAVAFRRGVHFKIDILSFKNPIFSSAMNAIAYAISCLFVYIILYYGYKFSVMGLTKLSLPSGIPMFYFRLSFPISGLFMLYYCVEGIVKSIFNITTQTAQGEAGELL